MWVSWLSAREGTWRRIRAAGRGMLLGLLLGLAGGVEQGERTDDEPPRAFEGTESPHPYPLCVEQLYTPESMAGCRIERYIEFETALVSHFPFNERLQSAAELLAEGEAYFSRGLYQKAWYAFDTARVNLPSYRAMVRAADASLYWLALGPEDPGARRGCAELDFPASRALVKYAWRYDTALIFSSFERERTGVAVPQEELDRTRLKSACMKRLANKYQYWLKPCVDRSEILKCLEAPG